MKGRGAKVLVIGIGNEHRGDDAAGLVVARRLRERGVSGVDIIEFQGEGTALIDRWAGVERVYLVDAVCSGAAAGTCFRLDGLRQIFPGAKLHGSTHGLGLAAAIELGRALDRLPRALMIYGIEGASFSIGDAISLEAQRGVEETVAAILEDLGHSGARQQPCTNGD
jgi:hydrogenase maturation protease